MMLGDSITATTCYPQLVWQDLRSAGHTNFTFIGSFINNQSCGVSGLKSVNPNAVLFVAQIIPVNPTANGCSSTSPCNYEATLDTGIPGWVASNTSAAMPVFAVNFENIFPNGYFANSTYTTDGVYPVLAGSQLMSTTMTAAIIAQGYF